MDAPQIPATEAERASAILALQGTVSELTDAGRYEDLLQLANLWAEALGHSAPEDKLALLEIQLLAVAALYQTHDIHAVERALWLLTPEADELVSKFAATGGNSPSPEAAMRSERAERVAGTLANNFGGFYQLLGDDHRARQSFLKALDLRSRRDVDLVLKAQTLANLATVEKALGQLTEAQAHILESLGIYSAIRDPLVAGERCKVISLVADVAEAAGNEDLAERALRDSVDTARSLPGNKLALAEVQSKLGFRLLQWGSPIEAETHVRQALVAYHLTVGLNDPAVVAATAALAHILWSRDQVDQAVDLVDRAGQIGDVHLRHRLEVGDEGTRIYAAAEHRATLDLCLSMAWHHPENADLCRAALDAVMRRKGLVTEVLSEQRREQGAHELAAVGEQARKVAALTEKHAAALLGGRSEETATELAGQVRQAEEILGVLQRLHSAPGSPEERARPEYLRKLSLRVSPSNGLPEVLSADGALIEYALFCLLERRPWEQGEPKKFYVALLWRGGTLAPRLVRLADAETIDDLCAELQIAVEEVGAALENDEPADGPNARMAALSERLRTIILDPVLIAAGDVRQLIIAPDGELASLSFAMLPNGMGHTIERYALSYVESGRDLLREPAGAGMIVAPPVVLADPDYDAGLAPGASTPEEGFARLPETRVEGEQVAEILGVTALFDGAASERRLREVHSPSILHVATHGWFLPSGAEGEQSEQALHPRLAQLRAAGALQGSGARTGLVLAGFNAAWADANVIEELGDGLLTAGEAASLDLAGTELVVLSACDSGRGQVIGMEGAHGLRRAFLLAGARSIVTAVWKIPDGPSRAIMGLFYRCLLAGASRISALQQAQLAARLMFPSPQSWGGFVLHGETGPLRPETLAGLRGASQLDAAEHMQDRELQSYVQLLSGGRLDEMETLLETKIEPDGESALLAARAAGVLAAAYDQANQGEKAERWWRVAMDVGDDDASHMLASSLRRRGEIEEARRVWLAAAKRGHRDSTHAAGNEAHQQGDSDEAERWWAAAAEAGDPRGARALAAVAQRHGDTANFERWWRRAADLGDPEAAAQYGTAAHRSGQRDEAIRIWRAAAERGDLEATHNLGVALEGNDDPGAEIWWRRAADRGFPQSANNLANLLFKRGNRDGAIRYWRIAVEHGHQRAPVALGRLLLEQGQLDEAERGLRPAAERGDAEAAEVLAQLLNGKGADDEAARWHGLAEAAGQPEAVHRAGEAALSSGNADAAFEIWSRAVHAGYAPSAASIGSLLEASGHGEAAESWWAGAAEAGHGEAAERLAEIRLGRGDRDGARRALSRAAADGDRNAQRLLRLLSADEEHLRDRAERGHVLAMWDLFHLAALSGDSDHALARIAAAANAKDPECQLLAARLSLAQGGDANVANAERWLRETAETGRPEAAAQLADLYARQRQSALEQEWRSKAERLARAATKLQAGRAAAAAGKHAEADQHWRAAAEDGSLLAVTQLAVSLLGRDDPEGEQWARLGASRGDVACANTLGARYAQLHDDVQARIWFDHAINISRGH